MPKVFISYAWEGEAHREWVKTLADRLLNDGIEAVLDQYDLELGDRLPLFMEQSVSGADYVLIICTPTYKRKADARMGGVGYEGHIISQELLSMQNDRKFIPVIREGALSESLPCYLAGKLAIDLSDTDKENSNYQDLCATLYGTRKKPPVSKHPISQLRSKEIEISDSDKGPLRIVGVVVDEVTEPKLDGTVGSALYKVPLRLSRRPSSLWAKIFIHVWDNPPQWSTMHRFGIASVVGDKIVLDGTTIEEVRDDHKETLKLCIDEANKQEREYIKKQREAEEREWKQREERRNNIENVASSIEF